MKVSCVFILVFISFGMNVDAVDVPVYELNNGLQIPAIALGTYLGFNQNGIVKSENKQLRDVVLQAIDVGYRHIDTASIYETEAEVGEAIQMKVQQGVLRRKDVFVTTKLWNTHHGRSQVPQALMESLEKLGLSYVDLYLMHWPLGLNEDYSFSSVDFMETWAGMEDVHKQGLARSIGVSNFNKEQLSRVIKQGTIRPSVLQIEIHPQMVQAELVKFAQSEGIIVMGYSPLGSLVTRFAPEHSGPRIDDPVLVEIARKYGKTTPQIVLRWLVDRKVIPVTKTITPKRLQENVDIFNFNLTETEMAAISNFDTNTRYTLPSFWQTHAYYPFEKVENPIHPQMVQAEFVKFAQSEGIVVMGYSPLGSLVTRLAPQYSGPRIDDPVLVEIARKYGKTTPQIVLRWLVDRKIIPVTKTITPKRLQENVDIFNFNLTETEMAAISNFDTNSRYTLPSFWQTHAYYPFKKVENPVANPF